MELLLWIIAAYGMSNILVWGSIFADARNYIHNLASIETMPLNGIFKFLSGLIICMMCTSTWVGFFLSVVFWSPSHELLYTNEWTSWFLDGMLASGGVWTINALVEYWENNRNVG